jgi:hypothetical protein
MWSCSSLPSTCTSAIPVILTVVLAVPADAGASPTRLSAPGIGSPITRQRGRVPQGSIRLYRFFYRDRRAADGIGNGVYLTASAFSRQRRRDADARDPESARYDWAKFIKGDRIRMAYQASQFNSDGSPYVPTTALPVLGRLLGGGDQHVSPSSLGSIAASADFVAVLDVPRRYLRSGHLVDINRTFPRLRGSTQADHEYLIFGDARPFVTAVYDNPFKAGGELREREVRWVGKLVPPAAVKLPHSVFVRPTRAVELPLPEKGRARWRGCNKLQHLMVRAAHPSAREQRESTRFRLRNQTRAIVR